MNNFSQSITLDVKKIKTPTLGGFTSLEPYDKLLIELIKLMLMKRVQFVWARNYRGYF